MSPWLTVLANQCQRSSQAQVAAELGYSPAVICGALKGTYKGDVNTLCARVEGAFMGREVCCPVLGNIRLNHCLDHQVLPFAAINPTRVKLYKACRRCKERR